MPPMLTFSGFVIDSVHWGVLFWLCIYCKYKTVMMHKPIIIHVFGFFVVVFTGICTLSITVVEQLLPWQESEVGIKNKNTIFD